MKLDLEDALDRAMAVDGPVPAGRSPGIGDMLDAMGLVDPDEAKPGSATGHGAVRPEPKADPLDREVKGPLLKRLLELRSDANPERAPWPEEWFGATDAGQVAACQRLWGAVLHATLLELFRKLRAARELPPRRQPGHERSALSWIGTRDFREVCDLAGFEAEQVANWVWSEAKAEAPGAALLNRAGQGASA